MNGRKAGSDINLYKLFTEQCYNLLRDGGQCGIVIPSGIYTDLGAKQLREMLFSETQITGLFGFENRKTVFEGVDSRFKFVVLSFTKSGHTEAFPAAFMRLETSDLELFPDQLGLEIPVELIERLSPDSLSVMEFKNETDVQIAEKMLKFPLLGVQEENTWNITFGRELHMTDDAHLFEVMWKKNYFPLYEGKNIHQFTHRWGETRYLIDEVRGRASLLGHREDLGQELRYERYRIAYRAIASSTNERSLIAAILPRGVFSANSVNVSVNEISAENLFFASALLNSFVVDFSLRQRVSANINMLYIYQLPIPRLTSQSPAFSPIVTRAAKLICTTPEFDDLAAEVGLGSSANGVTDPGERAALRAELDGLVAHLYGLTEEEFAYILTTFPLVDETVKTAALTAFNQLAPEPDVVDGISQLIAAGESEGLEFKSTARVNLHTGAADKKMEEVILKTVTGFWNAVGGTLLVGVADDGAVLGLDADLQTLGRKNNLDGLELFLTDLLLSQRPSLSGLVRVSFHTVLVKGAGKTVCIAVEAAPEPVWVTVGGVEKLFVRTGNATHSLSGAEAYGYARRRWG